MVNKLLSSISRSLNLVKRAKPFRRLFYFTGYFVPRRSNVWAFGCWHGDFFGDNSKYLFLHTANNESDIRPIWISKNPEVVGQLRENGYEAYHASSWKGRLYNLIAGKVVITNSLNDVNMWCSAGADIIQLWHGVPLKKIAADEPKTKQMRFLEKDIIRPIRSKLYEDFTYLTVTSEKFRPIFSSALKMDENRIHVDGYPRNDIFRDDVQGSEIGVEDQIEEIENIPEEMKIVTYLPTWRDNLPGPIEGTEWDFEDLNQFLKSENLHMVLKFHQYENLEKKEGLSNVTVLTKNIDIYPIIKRTDILLTDYSSIYFDYMIANKPIVFFPYDLEKYEEYRDFYFNYDEIAPGPKAENYEELKEALKEVKKKDNHKREREKARDKVFDKIDSKSGERIISRYL